MQQRQFSLRKVSISLYEWLRDQFPGSEVQFGATFCICLSIQLYSNFRCGNFKASNKDSQVLHGQVRLNKTLPKCFDVPYSFFFQLFRKGILYNSSAEETIPRNYRSFQQEVDKVNTTVGAVLFHLIISFSNTKQTHD